MPFIVLFLVATAVTPVTAAESAARPARTFGPQGPRVVSPEVAADGKVTKRQINLREVGVRGRVENDIVLLPDDVVYVPEMVF